MICYIITSEKMTLAFSEHDHGLCRKAKLREVEAICAAKGLRLTDMRKRVLIMLLKNHAALGAYELLAQLAREGQPAQPPIIYRALAFLTENGFAHKVERLNAYVACHFPDKDHNPGFLICRSCKIVGETCVASSPLAEKGFHIESEVMEAEGVCQSCGAGN